MPQRMTQFARTMLYFSNAEINEAKAALAAASRIVKDRAPVKRTRRARKEKAASLATAAHANG